MKTSHITKLLFQVNIERIVNITNASGQLTIHVEEKFNPFHIVGTIIDSRLKSLKCEKKTLKSA